MSNATFQWSIFQAALDPVIDSEQSGTRPVLVISCEIINIRLPIVTILPITSRKKGRKIYPTEVILQKGISGLKVDSIVMAHQIRTISKERLSQRIGVIKDEASRERIRDIIRVHLDLI